MKKNLLLAVVMLYAVSVTAMGAGYQDAYSGGIIGTYTQPMYTAINDDFSTETLGGGSTLEQPAKTNGYNNDTNGYRASDAEAIIGGAFLNFSSATPVDDIVWSASQGQTYANGYNDMGNYDLRGGVKLSTNLDGALSSNSNYWSINDQSDSALFTDGPDQDWAEKNLKPGDWGSNRLWWGETVECNRRSGLPDFTATLEGLIEGETYAISVAVLGRKWEGEDGVFGTADDQIYDFAWGTAADGSAVNIWGVVDNGVKLWDDGNITGLYVVNIGNYVADASGALTFYLGNGQEGGNFRTMYDGLHVALVPEPATMAILGLGALLLRRRK